MHLIEAQEEYDKLKKECSVLDKRHKVCINRLHRNAEMRIQIEKEIK